MAVATVAMPRPRRRVVTVAEVRRRVAAEREVEAVIVPTAARVRAALRDALAGYLGEVLTVRIGSGRSGETAEMQLVAGHEAGALCRTVRGEWGRWIAYHDLYTGHAAILAPLAVRNTAQRAIARLRAGAPTPKGGV